MGSRRHIERAKDHPEKQVRDEHGHGCADAVVKREKPRGLQLPHDCGPLLFARHAGMKPRDDPHSDRQDKRCVHEADRGTFPPGRAAPDRKCRYVNQREEPAVDEVEAKADDLGAVPVRRKHRAQHVRDVHAREPDALSSRHHRCEDDGAPKAPDEPARPVHGCTGWPAPAASGENVRRARGRRPSRRCWRLSAALIRPMCVNACGKFPSASPVAGSISSANSPTSLPYATRRSKRRRASSAVPPPSARYSAPQKPQTLKAPSPGDSPVRYRYKRPSPAPSCSLIRTAVCFILDDEASANPYQGRRSRLASRSPPSSVAA